MKYLIMYAWLSVCMLSIEVKESFTIPILKRLKFFANCWLAIFKNTSAAYLYHYNDLYYSSKNPNNKDCHFPISRCHETLNFQEYKNVNCIFLLNIFFLNCLRLALFNKHNWFFSLWLRKHFGSFSHQEYIATRHSIRLNGECSCIMLLMIKFTVQNLPKQ